MNISDEIIEAKNVAGRVASAYVKAATFGNDNREIFWDLLRANTYIRTLENNQCEEFEVKSYAPLEGQKVSLSSLTKQGNRLFLANQTQQIFCSTADVEPCLSDEDICEIIELSKVLGLKYP